MHIDRTGGKARLESDAVLTPADFARVAEELGQGPVRAREVGYVAARKAKAGERVETRWNGREMTNTAKRGDFVVTVAPARAVARRRGGNERLRDRRRQVSGPL